MHVERMRDYINLFESDYSNGVYCSCKPSKETIKNIVQFIKDNAIMNAITPADIHCTLIYSKKGTDEFQCKTEYNEPIKCSFSGWDLFDEDKSTLVMKIKSRALTERHMVLLDEYELSHSWASYEPHITISYDAKGFDIKSLPAYTGSIEFLGEESNSLKE